MGMFSAAMGGLGNALDKGGTMFLSHSLQQIRADRLAEVRSRENKLNRDAQAEQKELERQSRSKEKGLDRKAAWDRNEASIQGRKDINQASNQAAWDRNEASIQGRKDINQASNQAAMERIAAGKGGGEGGLSAQQINYLSKRFTIAANEVNKLKQQMDADDPFGAPLLSGEQKIQAKNRISDLENQMVEINNLILGSAGNNQPPAVTNNQPNVPVSQVMANPQTPKVDVTPEVMADLLDDVNVNAVTPEQQITARNFFGVDNVEDVSKSFFDNLYDLGFTTEEITKALFTAFPEDMEED